MNETMPEEFLKEEPALLRQLLWERGIRNAKEADIFLSPAYERDLFDPFLMKGMKEAAARTVLAIKNDEKITIYADYDCDGCSGAAIFADFFGKIGYKNFDVYIPAREEGYGLQKEALVKIAKNNTNLLITIDCGVANYEEVEFAKGLGLEVIVTDHHLPPEILPRCVVINPKQPGCIYPGKMLCGAAVAFKLVEALMKEFKILGGQEKWLLDLVALATLADQVPLLGENRALVHFGLKVLNRTRRIGLKEIIKLVRLREIREDDVVFSIVPRLNSLSRLLSPNLIFEILSTNDLLRVKELIEKLEESNKQRKILVALASKEIKQHLAKRKLGSIITIGNPDWHLGILGLIATNVMKEFNRPCFVWTRVGDMIKGSCRSPDINLVNLMRELPKESLVSFGGHAAAGGFVAAPDQIHFLEEKLCQACGSLTSPETEIEIKTARKVSLADVTPENFRVISRLAPFGQANPKPAFLFENMQVKSTKRFGQNQAHLSVTCEENNREVDAVSFYEKRNASEINSNEMISFIANIEQGFRGGLRLRIDSFV